MSYKVSVDGVVIGSVSDEVGNTLIGSALHLAGDRVDLQGKTLPESTLGEHGPKSVVLVGNEVRITTHGEENDL